MLWLDTSHSNQPVPLPATPQVCLAAERCGHLRFDARANMWWSGEGFYCTEGEEGGAAGAAAAAAVGFWDIYCKVYKFACGWLWLAGWLAGWLCTQAAVPTGCSVVYPHPLHRRHLADIFCIPCRCWGRRCCGGRAPRLGRCRPMP
jgi:hypothetical protein